MLKRKSHFENSGLYEDEYEKLGKEWKFKFELSPPILK